MLCLFARTNGGILQQELFKIQYIDVCNSKVISLFDGSVCNSKVISLRDVSTSCISDLISVSFHFEEGEDILDDDICA